MPETTGHLRVEERRTGRVWIAKIRRADGSTTRRLIGPAWVKDSGRRRPRGGVIWRAADGTRPDGHLTPKEAAAALEELLAGERSRGNAAPAGSNRRRSAVTFAEAVGEWLRYVEHDKGIAPSTLRRYRGIARNQLLPEFGERTPLTRITPDRIDRWRERQLADRRWSRDAVRQHLIALNGVLGRATRRGWIAFNPMAAAERVAPPRPSGDFNVLEPVQVHAVAEQALGDWEPCEPGGREHTRIGPERAAAISEFRRWNAEQYAAAIVIGAFSGLRIGELRALRWRDVDWTNRILHVRRNAPTSAPAASAVKAPKSGLVRSVPLTDPVGAWLERLSRRDAFTAPDDHVLCTPLGGMVDGGDARDAFYSALERAGLGDLRTKPKPIVFHDLRHTFGTLAVRAYPLSDVQAWMGHVDVKTTMRYVHHVPRHDAAEKLSRLFAAEVGVDAATPAR